MVNVVAGVIKNEEGKILITQRNLRKAQGGLWEFPGGKIEPNETKENAIVREIKEELNMSIICDGYFDKKIYEYPDKIINLIALKCTMIGESYDVLEHEQIAWITKEEFENYEFAPADIYFVEKITNES